MAKYDAYSVACNPETFTVLGLQLLPLSLGKILFFQRLGLPYFNNTEEKVTFNDFITAVFICAMTYKQFNDLVNAPRYKMFEWENIKSFGRARKYTPLEWQVYKWSKVIEKNLCNVKSFNLYYEISKFNNYLNTIKNEPNIMPGDNASSKKSEAPWILSIITVLTGELNYSFDEAVEMPVAKAMWEFYKYAESQGSVEFFNVEELEANNLITYLKE